MSIFVFFKGISVYSETMDSPPTIVTCDIFKGKCTSGGGCSYNVTFGTKDCVIHCQTNSSDGKTYVSKGDCGNPVPDVPDIIFLPFPFWFIS